MDTQWDQDQMAAIAETAEWFASVVNYPSAEVAIDVPAAVQQWLPEAQQLIAARQPVTYSGLFDIGSPEPPVPLMESHYHPDGQTRLRRVVNFYRTYGVRQDTSYPPDHLAVELAYLAYLSRVALLYPDRDDLQAAVQAFARLHPGGFVGKCHEALVRHDTEGVYAAIFGGLRDFLAEVGGNTRIPVTNDIQPSIRPLPTES